MTVIARFSVPAEEFPMGEVLEAREGVQIRLESMIPTGEAVIPYFWVANEDAPAVESALRESPLTDEVRVVDEVNDETLFRVDWATEINGVIDALVESNAVILEGQGRGDSWLFHARFRAHDDLSAFYRNCLDAGIRVDLNQVSNPVEGRSGDGFGLSDDQRQALTVALAEGYFSVPRGVTLVELAETLGISDSAVSQRIRRGLNSLVSATLVADPAEGDSGREE